MENAPHGMYTLRFSKLGDTGVSVMNGVLVTLCIVKALAIATVKTRRTEVSNSQVQVSFIARLLIRLVQRRVVSGGRARK